MSDVLNCLFVALGRWERKGFPLLLEAVRQANAGRDPIRVCLHVAGSPGRGEAHLLDAVEALARVGTAKYHGFCSDVSAAYREADVLVVASCYETLSLVMLDAIRFGLPVVSAPVNGVEELLGNANGLVVAREPAAFCAALLALHADRQRLKTMGENSAALRERFSAPAIARQTLAVYEESLVPTQAGKGRLQKGE